MKNKYFLFMMFGFFLISLSFVGAQPPFQTSTEDVGLIIEIPKYTYIKAYEQFKFHSHVFNSTDGLLVTNETTDCILHLYYHNGSHAFEADMGFDSNALDFEYTIPAEGVIPGVGAYIIQCNASTQGGFSSGGFQVTISGVEPMPGVEDRNGMIVLVIFGAACFLLFLSLQFNEGGLKIFFMLLSIVFLVSSLYTSYVLVLNNDVKSYIADPIAALGFTIGILLVLLMFYFLIRITINALDLFRIKRGREWSVGAGSKVGGYSTRRPY